MSRTEYILLIGFVVLFITGLYFINKDMSRRKKDLNNLSNQIENS